MGRDILRGRRGHIGHLRRRGSSRNAPDAQTLRRRSSNPLRENDLRFLVADRADDFYLADIFYPVRCHRQKNFFVACNDFARTDWNCGGRNFDCGTDDFGDGQGRALPDFAFPDNPSDFSAGDCFDGNIFDGRGVRGKFACRHDSVRFDFDNGGVNSLRLSLKNF